MAGEVVEDDDIARFEDGGELCLHIGVEYGPVHRRIDDPRCDKAVAFEARHKGLRAPVAERRLAVQPFSFQGTPAKAGHFCVGSPLIDKDQPPALLAHDGLAAFFPVGARLGQFRPVLFACPQSFF